MIFEGRAEAMRRRLLRPGAFRLYLVGRVPLAAVAGLRLARLDEDACEVTVPGGWRTRNPFGSMYFAAQAMAAEAATAAPALALAAGASASVSPILREVHAVFSRRITATAGFRFEDLAGMKAAVERAAASGESETYAGRVVGVARGEAEAAAEFRIAWSFKRRR